MFARTCERCKGVEGKDDEKGEEREKLRKEKSRDGEAAIDLILQQETPRGKELVLLEMQPAPVGEQTPPPSLSLSSLSPLSLSLPPLPSFSFSSVPFSLPIISSYCHFNIGSHFNEFLPPRCFK